VFGVRLLVGTIVCAGLAAAASVHRAAIPPVVTVNCAVEAATLFLDPPGKLRVVEYAYDPERSVQTRITCEAPTKDIGLDFQLRLVVNKGRRVIGNRIVVHLRIADHPTPGVEPKFKKVAVADGWVTRKRGGISYAPELCSRNMY
jgi:hypothetical protein